MSFSCKIILDSYKKMDGCRLVLLQAIVDRQRAVVSLGFYLKEEYFDSRRQCVKSSHSNERDYNIEMMMAIAKANTIASKFRQDGRALTTETFRSQYRNPPESMDFIKFLVNDLELRRPSIAPNTYKQHRSLINRLTEFKKKIAFDEISIELIQRFRNHLIKKGNGPATIEKVIKILKQYISEARKKGHTVKDVAIKIKTFKSNRLALTQLEVDKLDQYYRSTTCPENHQKVLRYFLFSCYSGVRISDIAVLTWNNVHDDLLIFTPIKTRFKQETVTIPLRAVDKQYLPAFKTGNRQIFETFTDQASNRIIKQAAEDCGIKKKITYHTSRHTFGSLFAEGGNIVALQKMMGHGDIKTTMGYVHTSTKNLVDAKKARFG